jgi:predicted AlkP superfamily pyrophosphatase or phosphodiesterase
MLTATLLAGCANQSDRPYRVDGPRAVVIIVLDQFRWDYFERFTPHFGEGGFARFSDEGAVLSNVRYRHAATLTCPGHATVATGASANVNGIPANDWFDVEEGRKVYCVEDTSVGLLGDAAQGRSPVLLEAPAIGDVLKDASPASKVFAVAGKDRASIMLGGLKADAAYWLKDSVFVTSTYYMGSSPDWVERFNSRRLPQSMHGAVWERVLAESTYDSTQGPDDFWHEEDRHSLGKTFPHTITGGSSQLDWDYYEALRKSPFEDEIMLAFVEDLVREEAIGKDETTDILGIGFSTVDRIGHPYGPDSHEIMDNVIRTDRVLSRLFQFLDEQIGFENIVVVLTADHGVQRFPELVADPEHGIWAARMSTATVRADIGAILDEAFGPLSSADGWIARYYYPHLYFNRQALDEKGVDAADAAKVLAAHLPEKPGYDAVLGGVFAEDTLSPEAYSTFPGRSGDVLVRLADHHISRNSEFGTTHGTPWDGDQHVPMLWLGRSIEHVRDDAPHQVVDLAPTLARILGLEPAPTMDGAVIPSLVRVTRP